MKSVTAQSGKSNLLNLPDVTPSFLNPKYPNRLSNQSLQNRSKQICRPDIQLPPEYNKNVGWKIARKTQQQYYTRQSEWVVEAEEVLSSGLVLVKTAEGCLFYNNKNEWFTHKQDDKYKGLQQTESTILNPIAKKLGLTRYPTDYDDLNPECCRKLARIRLNNGHAIFLHIIYIIINFFFSNY